MVAPHHVPDKAAPARAEGKDIIAALCEGVVDAALAVIRCPVCNINTPCHRVFCNNLDAAPEIFRLLLRRREDRQIARLDAARQLARREYVELVEITARNSNLELRAHVVLPDLHRLIRQAVDEVGNDDGALPLHHPAERCDNRLTVVDASDRLADARVKGLHTKREPVDARMQRHLHHTLRKIVDASLECDFTVARERQAFAYRTDKAHQISLTERRRGTAAKEYRLEGRAHNIGRICRGIQLLQENINVMMRRLLPREVLEKSAVAAFLIAERDVDVYRTLVRGIRRRCHVRLPDTRLLRLVHDHALAARAGMHNALFCKGAPERVLRLRPEQPAACFLREGTDLIL